MIDLNAINSHPPDHATFRILTAPGPGAVAVVELRGDAACCDAAVLLYFQTRGAKLQTDDSSVFSIGRVRYGHWKGEDLVVVRTSETTLEIQCHGGAVVIERICSDLISDGLIRDHQVLPVKHQSEQVATVEEEISKAIENRLPFARSPKTAGLLLAQGGNSLAADLKCLRNSSRSSELTTAIQERLRKWKDVADHLTEPWLVVLAGAPNVGKSSLMNAISGKERAIVFEQPGTTRDIVEFETMIDGWPFRFLDTAGIRFGGEVGDIEEIGIQQSIQAVSECDVLCLVVDDRAESWNLSEVLNICQFPEHVVVIRNKSDLPRESGRQNEAHPDTSQIANFSQIELSAFHGTGVDNLLRWIRQAVVPEEPTRVTSLPIVPMAMPHEHSEGFSSHDAE